MGFAQGLGRFFSGKPVFDASDVPNQNQPQQNTPGGKYIPVVFIEEAECDIEGTNMRVSITIKNESTVEVFIDKIRLVNTTKELDSTLRAGEEKQYHSVFHGPRPNHTSYSECQLEYRDTTGDYFRTNHYVEYTFEPDKTYSVRRITYQPPVKDI
jgi:hypothetical protein